MTQQAGIGPRAAAAAGPTAGGRLQADSVRESGGPQPTDGGWPPSDSPGLTCERRSRGTGTGGGRLREDHMADGCTHLTPASHLSGGEVSVL
ncbi:hypothetical protein AAFF_G00066070 [Aldrovandia affinis]|uniref:Uncharacterized protein n=1 Tax=Aldrovandia affinis TaxID=143900 RepID=A0AAD7T3Y5_9TELE|nr:hypothetical protein AAFF_G00066070 [Aldrovandia affinis]